MKKIIPILALASFLGLSFAPKSMETKRALAEGVNYKFVENCDLVHVRLPGNPDNLSSFGNELVAFGTNWEQGSMPDLSSNKSSYARLVLNAPSAGTYEMKINYAAEAYALKVYTNSSSTVTSHTLPSNGWAGGSATINLNLQAGKNVVIFQVNNWGQMQSFEIDETVTVINHHSTEAGTYNASDIIWQEAYLESSMNIFDPDAATSYRSLDTNENYSFEGAAILHFTPDTTVKIISSNEVEIDNNSYKFLFTFKARDLKISLLKTTQSPQFGMEVLSYCLVVQLSKEQKNIITEIQPL